MGSEMNPLVVITRVDSAMNPSAVTTLLLSLGPSHNPSMFNEDIEKVKSYVSKMQKIFPNMPELTQLALKCDSAIFYIHEYLPSDSKNWTPSKCLRYKNSIKKDYYNIIKKLITHLPYLKH